MSKEYLPPTTLVATELIKWNPEFPSNILSRASDGELYEFEGGHYDRHTVRSFDRVVGLELYRALGINATPWVPLMVSDFLIRKNLRQPVVSREGAEMVWPGVYVATRPSGGVVLRLLPSCRRHHLTNHIDFWCAAVLQALCRSYRSAKVDFQFLDADTCRAYFKEISIFLCPASKDIYGRCAATIRNMSRNETLTREEVSCVLDRFAQFNLEDFWTRIEALPSEWYENRMLDQLYYFASSLPKMAHVGPALRRIEALARGTESPKPETVAIGPSTLRDPASSSRLPLPSSFEIPGFHGKASRLSGRPLGSVRGARSRLT